MRLSIILVWFFLSRLSFLYGENLINHSPLSYIENKELPRETTLISFHGGASLIPKDLQGLGQILIDILSTGPKDMNENEFKKFLFLKGSKIEWQVQPKTILVQIECVKEFRKNVYEVMAKILAEPKFNEIIFQKSKGKVITNRKQEYNDMAGMVRYFSLRMFFGYHRDILDDKGSLNSLQNVKLKNIQEYFRELFRFEEASFYYLGDANKNEVLQDMNEKILRNKKVPSYENKKTESLSSVLEKIPHPEKKVSIIDKPDATDHQIILMHRQTFPADTKEFLAASLMMDILGGGISSRLGKELREEKGLTYGVFSYALLQAPAWGIWTFGGDKQIKDLLVGIKNIKEKFLQEKIKSEELKQYIEKRILRMKSEFELDRDFMVRKIIYTSQGWDTKFLEDYTKNILSVTPDQVETARQELMKNPENMRLYMMGNYQVLEPVLLESGYKKEEIETIKLENVN